jgi:hypothetical protein
MKKYFTLEDVVGQEVPNTKWTVLHFSHISNSGAHYWMCRCACGREKPVSYNSLSAAARGKPGTSGCKPCAMKIVGQAAKKWHPEEWLGKVFPSTQWTVIGFSHYSGSKGFHQNWLCQCSCGTILPVQLNSLIDGSQGKTNGSLSCRPCGMIRKGLNSRQSGRIKGKDGYVRIPTWAIELPEYVTRKGGDILEHVYVMSCHLNRSLLPHENVHHINGVRDDNRLENLELWSTSQPAGQRVIDKLQWAREIIDLYGNEETKHESKEI